MSLGTYSKWENRGELGVPDFLRLTKMLRCDPCWVLTGIGLPLVDAGQDDGMTKRVMENVTKLEREFAQKLREDAVRSLGAAEDLVREAEDRPDAEAGTNNLG